MKRIVVVGTSGSGKTTLAAALSRRIGVPHVELDALYHEPGWTEAVPAVFRERVERAVWTERWIVDGNYPQARDIVLPRATTVAWLDLPRALVMRRVIWRSLSRAALRRELWNGNRERFRGMLSAEHPIRWAWSTHGPRRREYTDLADERWVRLRSARAVREWLAAAPSG